MFLRKKIAALAVAGATVMSVGLAAPAFAEESDNNNSFSSEVSLSSGGGLLALGAIIGVFALEGFSSALNAPYCGANPDKCPNSLTASLSSTASSEIDKARTMVPRVPTTVNP